jgi:hypothetical protein
MKVKFYHKKNGKQPVIEFLDALPSEETARIVACLSNIEMIAHEFNLDKSKAHCGKSRSRLTVAGIGYFMYVFRAIILYCCMPIRSNHKKPGKKKLKLLKNV